MKEIDDQYSEYFPMNETVKGVKHKSKLGFSISSALPFCTAALIATMLIANVPQKTPFVLPEYPGSFSEPEAPVVSEQVPKPSPPPSPNPAQTPQPTPTPTPTSTPAPTPTPTPTPAPTPTPTPAPTPAPTPTPTPTQITYVPYDYGGGPDIGPLPTPPPATKTAPAITAPTFVFHTGQLASEVSFSMTMNDLQGGSATATLYCKKGGVFVPCSNPSAKAVYPGSGNVWTGTLYSGDSDSEGLQTTLKLVIDYTYPDGESGRYESAEQTGFTGHIIVFPGPNYSYDPASRTYTADYVIDSLLKDGISTYTEAVYFAPTEQDLKDHTHITGLNSSDYTVTVLQHDEADGVHVTIRYQFAADPTPGYYHFVEHINYSGSYGTAEDWRISRPHLP